MTTIQVPSSEAQLVSYYSKPLTSAGRFFQVKGTYTASPYRINITTYANADEAEGKTAKYPTNAYVNQNPSDWFPADVLGEIAPVYPMIISRGQYSMSADDAVEERQIKDFLGIDPAGQDLDAYLSTRTQSQLDEWRTYWSNAFSAINVPGALELISLKYQQYSTTPTNPPPTNPPPTTPTLKISGHVLDAATLARIPNAIVEWFEQKTVSASDGTFTITPATAKVGFLKANATGYASFIKLINLFDTPQIDLSVVLAGSTSSGLNITDQPPIKYDTPDFFRNVLPEQMRMLEPGSPEERAPLKDRLSEFQKYAIKGIDDQFTEFHKTHSPILPEEAVPWVVATAGAAGVTYALTAAAGTLAEVAGLGQIETVGDFLKDSMTHFGIGLMAGVPIADTYNIALRTPFNNYLRKEYRTTIPNISDQVRFTVREAWPAARDAWKEGLSEEELAEEEKNEETLTSPFYKELRQWGAYQGYRDEHLDAFWFAHWQLPSTTQLFDMLHRGVINDATLTRMLIQNDIHPAWIERIKRIAFEVPRLVDIRTGYEFGGLTEEAFVHNLTKRGYDPEDITWIVQASKNTILRDDFNRVRTQLVAEFVEGYTTEDTLRDSFDMLGLNHDTIDMNVREAKLKRNIQYRKKYEDAILDKYQKEEITEAQARDMLKDIVVDVPILDNKIEERQLRMKAATA